MSKRDRIDDNSFVLSYSDLINLSEVEFIFEEYYTVNYHFDEEEVDSVFKGMTISNLKTFNKDGFNFIGYYLDQNLSNLFISLIHTSPLILYMVMINI